MGRKAVFDCWAVIADIGSIASIVSLLWIAYEKFIAGQGNDTYLYIGIRKPDGSSASLKVAGDFPNAESLAREFLAQVSDATTMPNAQVYYDQAILEITQSSEWQQVERKHPKR